MGFETGTISMRRFAVDGTAPPAPTQELLDKIAAAGIAKSELGVPDAESWGFNGGRHVLDSAVSFAASVYAECVHFGMRVDTNKVPASLLKAWQLQGETEAAAASPSGFASKAQRKHVKDAVAKRAEAELREGKHAKSKVVPLLWDLPSATLYANASGATFEKLADLFERTFGLSIGPVTAGAKAYRVAEAAGVVRQLEDAKATKFGGSVGADLSWSDYPWVSKGVEPKDFLGNEFLLWLWHQADALGGVVKTSVGDVCLFLDKGVEVECCCDLTGKDVIKGDGPGRMPEAMEALASGKVPRRVGLLMASGGGQYALTLGGEGLAVAGLRLPEVEEADGPRTVFEERVTSLRNLWDAIDALYATFLKVRLSAEWAGVVATLRSWAKASAAVVAA